MIVRPDLNPRKIFLITWRKLLLVVGGLTLGVVLRFGFDFQEFHLSAVLAILGTALAILLGFRNNHAYERWWEARRLWGKLVNESRSFVARLLVLTDTCWGAGPDGAADLNVRRQALTYRHLAFVHALKLHLRRQEPWDELRPFVPDSELTALRPQRNVPNALLLTQQRALKELFEHGFTDNFRLIQLDTQMAEFYAVLGGCERIKNTVFPRQYSVYTAWALHVFLMLLPLNLTELMGWLGIPFALITGFVFIILEYVGSHIENPFENSVNDIPMSALARTIEINLRQNLGETDLPAEELPIDGYLY